MTTIKIISGASSPLSRFAQRVSDDGVDGGVEEIGVQYGFRFKNTALQKTLAQCAKEFSVLKNFDYPSHSLTMHNKYIEGFNYLPKHGAACVKDGVKASNAIAQLFRGVGSNKIDCDIGVQLCMFEALRRHLGDENFDVHFNALPMYVTSTRIYHPLLTQHQERIADLSKLLDGDMLFFANHTSYAEVHPIGIAQGQWTVVTDSAKLEFGGHFGVSAHYLHTAAEIFEELVTEYNYPSDHLFYKQNRTLWEQEVVDLQNVLRDNPKLQNKSEVMRIVAFYDEAVRLSGLDDAAMDIELN